MNTNSPKWAATGITLAASLFLTACAVHAPGHLETSLAQQVKQKITVGGTHDKNPFTATDENIAAGREAFSHYCQVCHGLDAQNTGVPFADRMSPPVPMLNSPAVQRYTDGQLKWVIDNGVFPSGMPANKGTLSDEEIWKIVVYLRHLPPKGSLGEPVYER